MTGFSFLKKEKPMPHIICFTSSQGLEFGLPIRWINKLWLVKTKTGSCYVMPSQLVWAY